jgi:hypothetical protein
MGRIRYFTIYEIREYLMKIMNTCLRCDIIKTEMLISFIKNKKDMGILMDIFSKTLGIKPYPMEQKMAAHMYPTYKHKGKI